MEFEEAWVIQTSYGGCSCFLNIADMRTHSPWWFDSCQPNKNPSWWAWGSSPGQDGQPMVSHDAFEEYWVEVIHFLGLPLYLWIIITWLEVQENNLELIHLLLVAWVFLYSLCLAILLFESCHLNWEYIHFDWEESWLLNSILIDYLIKILRILSDEVHPPLWVHVVPMWQGIC